MNSCLTILDSSRGEWLEGCDEQLGAFRVQKNRLRGGTRDGVDLLRVSRNGFEVEVVPTRGMSLRQVSLGTDKSQMGKRVFGWQSPVQGPVHPSYVPVAEPSGLGWLDGFDELLVRCGLVSNGVPQFDDNGQLVFPLHGRIGNLPADQVEVHYDGELDELKIKGTVVESRFHFGKWKLEVEYVLSGDQHSIQVRDRVTNMSGKADSFQMLYHFNLGNDLLEPGGRIEVPATRVIPRNEHSAKAISKWNQVESPQSGFVEEVYFLTPQADASGKSLAMLSNADQTAAAGVRYSVEDLPCFSVWKNFASKADGYVVGLEPATNYPNSRDFEASKGRVVSLEPGESKVLSLELLFANERKTADSLLKECREMQPERSVLESRPDPEFCE